MATTPIEFTCPTGLTLTGEVYPYGSDTIGNTGGDAATEATNRKGLYSFSVAEELAGWHTVIIKEGTDIRAVYHVFLVDDTNIHRCHEYMDMQYEDGAIWIDTVNGAAGTTTFLNGTPTNPVNSIADALTLAAALKIRRLHVAPGSSITLAATVASYELYGVNWTLALGSQAITGSKFIGASVTGTGTTSGATPEFEDCSFGAVNLPPIIAKNCAIAGTFTMGSAGNFLFFDCKNGKGTTSDSQFTFIANCNLKLINCNGYFSFASADNTDVVQWYGGSGKAYIRSSCNGINAQFAGSIELVNVDDDSTVADTSRWNEDQRVAYVNGQVLGIDLGESSISGPGAWALGHDGWPLFRGVGVVFGQVANSGTTSTLTDTARIESEVDFWKGSTIVFTAGPLMGLSRTITGFDPDTDTLTFSPPVPIAVTTDTYEIWPTSSSAISPVGAGAIEVDIISRDEDSNPIDGVEVWITPDEAGSSVIAGTLVSDNNGITKFQLDDNMVYWVWRQRAGFNFNPNPESITVGTP